MVNYDLQTGIPSTVSTSKISSPVPVPFLLVYSTSIMKFVPDKSRYEIEYKEQKLDLICRNTHFQNFFQQKQQKYGPLFAGSQPIFITIIFDTAPYLVFPELG